MQPTFETCTIPVTTECRYLFRMPEPMPATPLLAVLAHGYGMNPATMLDLAAPALGPSVAIASIEAPHQFYLSDKPGSSASVGYNWGTAANWNAVVRMHHEIVLSVLAECQKRIGVGPERTFLLGFSQPVGLNYRFAATHPDATAGLIGICGGLPRDWEDSSYKPVTAAVLHISRDQDEYYPVENVTRFPDRLRLRAADVEFHLIPGQHRFPSQGAALIQAWLKRVFSI